MANNKKDFEKVGESSHSQSTDSRVLGRLQKEMNDKENENYKLKKKLIANVFYFWILIIVAIVFIIFDAYLVLHAMDGVGILGIVLLQIAVLVLVGDRLSIVEFDNIISNVLRWGKIRK